MNITIELQGLSPLLMHNPRMVDPQFEISREIKTITSKTKKTDADLAAVERLEWHGGLYTESVGDNGSVRVVQPTAKVRKCLVNTARISKEGKQVERALSIKGVYTPLVYDGPKEVDHQQLEAMYQDGRYTSRLSVGLRGKRIMRVRPQFFPWALGVEGVFIPDAGLNLDALERIVELAGQVEGIGDNRTNGYGRFEGKVTRP